MSSKNIWSRFHHFRELQMKSGNRERVGVTFDTSCKRSQCAANRGRVPSARRIREHALHLLLERRWSESFFLRGDDSSSFLGNACPSGRKTSSTQDRCRLLDNLCPARRSQWRRITAEYERYGIAESPAAPLRLPGVEIADGCAAGRLEREIRLVRSCSVKRKTGCFGRETRCDFAEHARRSAPPRRNVR